MRAVATFLIVAALVPTVAMAQEDEAKKGDRPESFQTYTVEIKEVQLSPEATEGLKVKELPQLLEKLNDDGKIERLEKVTLTVLPH